MLTLHVSAWELVLRAGVVYTVLLVMVRISGKRTVGQFTPFDLLLVMLVSEAAGPAMTGQDQSLVGGLLVCIILIGLNSVVGFWAARSRWAEKVLEGEAILLGRDGQIFQALRKKHRISENDIESALREADCTLAQMRCMFFEADGTLSILKKKSQGCACLR